ncbi:MAG TPA: polysaccharide biosynthesis/export family protein [bacterium]|nr:polysaccharide biosynthesis/export family protein [bacterium]
MTILRSTVVHVLCVSLLIVFPGFGEARTSAKESYKIGREDVLDISVWQSPDLTKTLAVGPDGAIPYPILGDLQVAARTPLEVQKMITEKLGQGYVKDPKVTVAVKEYNSKKILVFGEVQKPGLYKLRGNLPLLELLFLVGGVKPDAKRMTVIRPLKKSEADAMPAPLEEPSAEGLENNEGFASSAAKPIEVDLIALLSRGDLSQNLFIQPGDTIYVSSGTGEKYYVLGQVKKPGPYEWVEEITVLEAIKMAGGASEKAALNRINLMRTLPSGEKQSSKVNVGAIMQGKGKDDTFVKAGDLVVVPESWI